MAILKKSDLKNIPKSQIDEKLKELRKELMKYNAQRAIGTAVENPGKIKEIRKTIAKLHTINKITNKSEGGLGKE